MSNTQTYALTYDVLQKRRAVVNATSPEDAINQFRAFRWTENTLIYEDIASDADFNIRNTDDGSEWFYYGTIPLLARLK